jgi:hypothetical protein
LRRSIRSTVCGEPPASLFVGGAVCERANVAAAEVATADKKKLRRESIEASAKLQVASSKAQQVSRAAIQARLAQAWNKEEIIVALFCLIMTL